MLRVCIAGWKSPESDAAHAMLSGRPDLSVLSVRSTISEVVSTLRETAVDVVLFPTDWIEITRVIKQQVAPTLTAPPSFVLMSQNSRLAIRARALSCGFDGVIDVSSSPDDVVMAMNRIATSLLRLENDDDLRGLEILPGLLGRGLILKDEDDASLADFIASGVSDEAITKAMGWSVQEVRNRIARLLVTNDMKYRTQLAVAHASSFRIPDFHRTISE